MEIINLLGLDVKVANDNGDFSLFPASPGNMYMKLQNPKTVLKVSDNNGVTASVTIYNQLDDIPEKEDVVYMIPEEFKPAFFDREDICYPEGFIKQEGLTIYFENIAFHDNFYEGEDDCETI